MSQENETTPIAALGEDVLLKIFQYFDGFTLETCSSVCKEWDRIIGNSFKAMKNFQLEILGEWTNEDEIENHGSRKYSNIFIGGLVFDERMANIVKSFAINIRVLKFVKVRITDRLLTGILNSTKQLDYLQIQLSIIDNDDDVSQCTLATIKVLSLIDCGWEVLSILKNTQVSHLKIVEVNYETENAISFKEFMEKQTKLQSFFVFVCECEFYIDLEEITRKNQKIQLTRLFVNFHLYDVVNRDRFIKAFSSFLENSKSLQRLEFHKMFNSVSSFFKCLVLKSKITDLSFWGCFLPRDQAFYQIAPNNYLKTLVIRGCLHLDAAKGLLKVYPSIEKLVIQSGQYQFNELLIFMSQNCGNLQDLQVLDLESDTPAVTIPSLRTFRIEYVGDANQLQSFCVNNPSIEKLIVGDTSTELTYEVINTITTSLDNLKYLYLGRSFKPTTTILEMMARNCRKLQRFEVFDDDENIRTFAHDSNFPIHCYETIIQHFEKEPKWIPNTTFTSSFNLIPFIIDLKEKLNEIEDRLDEIEGMEYYVEPFDLEDDEPFDLEEEMSYLMDEMD